MEPETEEQRARLAHWSWQERSLTSTTPPRLEDGRRLIRVFPEWISCLPLWENYTDNYPFERDVLPLSSELQDRLVAWNDHWQNRDLDEEVPDLDRWIAEGRELVARLRDELGDIADVRAEFGL
ncbi:MULTISPECIES: hypothetical protein [Microbacterium]|uniref:hypothetical protein n=1 Tax=Microbacterium TaxID=33882 RepID=UPI00277D25FC|nr:MULTISPECIES: hypothetical protein [Microbacterium]MDQ1074683.1 hypothetical protein [Microbacterium sp. SORGH_AS_0969]MDQ1114908.1 hypothetical protein [Microbacterium testaceum]